MFSVYMSFHWVWGKMKKKARGEGKGGKREEKRRKKFFASLQRKKLEKTVSEILIKILGRTLTLTFLMNQKTTKTQKFSLPLIMKY